MMTQPGQQIEVDLTQLRVTCQTLTVDTKSDLKPGLSDTDLKIQQGVAIGASTASSELVAARQALGETLLRHVDNFASHLRQAEQLVTFLDVVLKEYHDADDLSGIRVDAVMRLLQEALPTIPEPPRTHGDVQ